MSTYLQNEFSVMLQAFNGLVKDTPSVEKVKKDLLELKKAAENSTALNYRQKEAIMARVDNYLKGDYYPRSMSPEQGKLAKQS